MKQKSKSKSYKPKPKPKKKSTGGNAPTKKSSKINYNFSYILQKLSLKK